MNDRDRRGAFSPLASEGGTTTVKEAVVSQIAGVAAGEVEGVHVGGGASRGAGGLLGRATGSSGQTRGVSVEVGQTEAAVDLKMSVEYGRDIPVLTEEVRGRVVNRVENLVGLAVTEVNVTVTDVVFPTGGEERRGEGEPDAPDGASGDRVETRVMPSRELRPGAREREVTEVEPTSREHTEAESGPVPEEDVRVGDTPVREDETAEIDVGEGEVEKRSEGSGPAGSARRVRRGGSGGGGSSGGGSGGGGNARPER